jgi:hypothetical protein
MVAVQGPAVSPTPYVYMYVLRCHHLETDTYTKSHMAVQQWPVEMMIQQCSVAVKQDGHKVFSTLVHYLTLIQEIREHSL